MQSLLLGKIIMSTSFTMADVMMYNSYHRLPYQERLEYLANQEQVTVDPEIFDKYRGVGSWVRYPDGSGWFEMRIPFERREEISSLENGYRIYREQDCRDLIAREGL